MGVDFALSSRPQDARETPSLYLVPQDSITPGGPCDQTHSVRLLGPQVFSTCFQNLRTLRRSAGPRPKSSECSKPPGKSPVLSGDLEDTYRSQPQGQGLQWRLISTRS